MVPHSPLWKSSTRPSLCFRGYPDSLTFSRAVGDWGDGDGVGVAVGVAVGVGEGARADGRVVALGGVVRARQQEKHSPNTRPDTNCCLRLDFSILSAAREEKRGMFQRGYI